VTLDAPKSGPSPAEVSYLTDGMNWSADYVAVVDADDKKAGLSGWVTIDNHWGGFGTRPEAGRRRRALGARAFDGA
jgi:hypothetical protein